MIPNGLYDVEKSFEENYNDGPFFKGPFPERVIFPKKTKIWNFEVNSPLGVPAGPLPNKRWIETYFKLGYDILVYKNVRSVYRECHPVPNCQYVEHHKQLGYKDIGGDLVSAPEPEQMSELAITNSFGVPSMAPAAWMGDVEEAIRSAAKDQLMITGILGTPGLEGRDLIEDFGYVASMAKEAGSKALELNFSCPNVRTGEGSIYADPEASALISKEVRKAVGPNLPIVIKIGYLPYEQLKAVVKENLPYVDGIAGINTIPMKVRDKEGNQALPGEGRLQSGICGSVITDVSQLFVEDVVQIKKELGGTFVLFGVGGIMTPEHAVTRLNAGADVVMTATAAMWDPTLAIQIQKELLKSFN